MVRINPNDFEVVGVDIESSDAIYRPSTSYWRDAMRRMLKNKTAIICAIFLVIVILMAIIVPMVSPYGISDQHVQHTFAPAFFTDPSDGHMHIFGTDDLGRDLFTRVWSGARISLFIAFTAVLVNVFIGVIYGGISGFAGGMVDNLMMRFLELVNGIPYLLIIILLMMVMEPGVATMIIAYSAVGWTRMARLVRGQVMSLKEQDFVIAAKTMGASPNRIIMKHLLPNTLSVVIVNITLSIPDAIFTEAFLSFIGLGVPIPLASWGTLANAGVRVFQQYPIQLAMPALFICLTMLSFNLLGDALRDALDPRLRR